MYKLIQSELTLKDTVFFEKNGIVIKRDSRKPPKKTIIQIWFLGAMSVLGLILLLKPLIITMFIAQAFSLFWGTIFYFGSFYEKPNETKESQISVAARYWQNYIFYGNRSLSLNKDLWICAIPTVICLLLAWHGYYIFIISAVFFILAFINHLKGTRMGRRTALELRKTYAE